MASNIRGVDFTKTQTEFQYFPEEYFSSSDLTIYFGDVWVDDITRLEFGMQEKVMPIYGYNSYTWDAAPRGNRLVQGYFSVAFREAGFLYRMMEHFGQLQEYARPKLAYQLGDQEIPEWIANEKENLDDMINRLIKKEPDEMIVFNRQPPSGYPTFADWPFMELGDNEADKPEVLLLQKFLLENVNKYPGLEPPIQWDLTYNMARIADASYINKDFQVKRLKIRLNGYLYYHDLNMITKLDENDDNLDSATEEAIKFFQSNFSKSFGDTHKEWGKAGPLTREYLNKPFAATGWFDAATMLTILRYQAANGLSLTGNFDQPTKESFLRNVSIKDKVLTDQFAVEDDYSDYESRVWGTDFTSQDEQYRDTYFYSGPYSKSISSIGFDVYINFGPLPEAVMQNGGKVPDKVSFNTTVRAIRNVQFTSLGQVIGADGTPIEEVYHFMARDIN